jgi:single-stranded-DNA-specific exonuclease
MLAGQPLPESILWIDGDLDLRGMTPELMGYIDRLEPFGEANEKPVLFSGDLRLAEPPRTVGKDGSHLILSLRRSAQVTKALAFGMAARAHELRMGEPLHVVYTPRWNTFRGERSLELHLHDFCTGQAPDLT